MHVLLENTKRVVIKLGTSILATRMGETDTTRIHGFCRQISALQSQGIEVIIVSSGAVGLGMGKLGCEKRPNDLTALQVCAAVGQSILIDTWQTGFDPYAVTVAQILLTWEDVRTRKRHVAVKSLFEKLLADGIVPIVNENDSVSTEEFKFGDNDILAALVASLTKAEMLLILSSAPGLIDREGSGEIVPVVEAITPEIEHMAGDTTSATSVGGMRSKIEAAKIVIHSGCGLFIGSGYDPEILRDLLHGEVRGTFFVPTDISLASKKRWLAFFEHPKGTITVDEGACRALLNEGRSLLAKGVTGHRGKFPAGAIITLEGPKKNPFARGITQYDSDELVRIAGQNSEQIRLFFPRRKRLEVVHRDSMVLLM